MPTYPTWRYHATREPVIVTTPEEDAALGPGWADAPVLVAAVEAPPATDDPAPDPTPKRRARRATE